MTASPLRVPRHVAIIMDGNGRWATQRHLPRVAGHKAGLKAVNAVLKAALKQNIEVLSLFAFSSENWRRPVSETQYLMQLFIHTLKQESEQLHKQNIQLRVLGDRSQLEPALQQRIAEAEALTANNTRMILLLAVNYGGHWDILEATRRIAADVASGVLAVTDIDKTCFEAHLSFPDLPYPDLFIRTSGEKRISNFILWQLAYTELYFTDVLWPDFNENHFDEACAYFATRERRFGRTQAQLEALC